MPNDLSQDERARLDGPAIAGIRARANNGYTDFIPADIAALCDAADERDRLAGEVEDYKKRMWQWSRGLIGVQPYAEDELRKMYGPYVERGETTDLEPREVRCLETLIATGAKADHQAARIAELEEKIDSLARYAKENKGEAMLAVVAEFMADAEKRAALAGQKE